MGGEKGLDGELCLHKALQLVSLASQTLLATGMAASEEDSLLDSGVVAGEIAQLSPSHTSDNIQRSGEASIKIVKVSAPSKNLGSAEELGPKSFSYDVRWPNYRIL